MQFRSHLRHSFLVAILFASSSWALEPLPPKAPVPAHNPMTVEKIELGKMLYFDPRISKTGTVSCNSCHNVMSGGTDGRPVSIGINGKRGGRCAPTVWNAAFMSVQFWDGRAPSLEEQAKGPMVNPIEMGMDNHQLVMKRIAAMPEYREKFKAAFGKSHSVTINNAAKAIAAYERTLLTPNSRFDRYSQGDKNALTAKELKGLQNVEALGCTSCHMGPNFAGPALPEGKGFFMKFPVHSGSAYEQKYKLTEDLGRYEVTKNDADKHVWRVPTWRNIALTAPYFHNGSVATLDEAVAVMAKTQLNKTLTKAEVSDIVAFLNTLTGEFPQQTMPRLPETPNTTFAFE